MTTPPDGRHAARSAPRSVHLSASAGSGKTRALKDRYLALLDLLDGLGLGIDQAVAITFTDKAAAEIKERVMRDLPEPMLKKIIRGLQDLRISTIHSFCMNLLKRYPLEAGLPPDFGILDARDQAAKLQKAIDDGLEESDRVFGQEILAPLAGYTADGLSTAVGFLLSIRSRLRRMEIDAGGADGLIRSVRAGLGIEHAESELQTLVDGTQWRTLLRKMERLLAAQQGQYDACAGGGHLRLAESPAAEAGPLADKLAPVYFTKEGAPRKSASIPKGKFVGDRREFEHIFFNLQDLLGRFRSLRNEVRAGRETLSLLHLALRCEALYEEAKLREALVDFDDLEIHAYRLLRSAESPDILYRLDRRILHVLVDEFQDTSDLQWAVLHQLTGELFSGQGADKAMPPSLFVVGDAKQSIYRFRDANYRLIEDVRNLMIERIPPEAREIRTLDKNYRSVPDVVDAVNRVFTSLWEGAYQPAEADRTSGRGSVRLIEIVGGGDAARGIPTEAEVLAAELRSLVGQGAAIREKSGDGWKDRSVHYGDCAVLIQSRAKLKAYETALRSQGVPFRVVGGIGFYEEEEIQAILNVLFFLWNRDDRLALAAALSSPLFGLNGRDIAAVFTADTHPLAALADRLPAVRALLREWENLSSVESQAGLIHRIVQDTGAYFRFGRQNLQAVFNIDKLLDTARDFDRRGYTTLQDFVEWVQSIRAAEQREATADMNLPGFQGAVSIMTVHKAKGLEFPVVFLPGMHQASRALTTGPDALIEEQDGGIRMSFKSGGALYDEMWERERNELRREHQRLLYVAMTRARDRLVMIGALNGGQRKQNTWLGYLQEALKLPAAVPDAQPGLIAYAHPDWRGTVVPAGAGASPALSSPGVTPDKAVDAAAIIEALLPLPHSKTPEWKQAVDFIKHELPVEPRLPGPGEVSPLVRGSVLHRCLEDFTTLGRFDAGRITDEVPELRALPAAARARFTSGAESLLRGILNNPDFAWIFRRGPGAYSELPFLMTRGKDIVSGIIDRVIVGEETAQVIDYKAIAAETEEELRAWRDHYAPQIEIYCAAVKEIFRVRRVEGYLLFLDSARLEPAGSA